MSQPEEVPSWVNRPRREETPESDYFNSRNPQPPSFKRPLVPTPHPPLAFNEPAKLSTKVIPVGDTSIKVSWFKDNAPLPDVPRYRANFDRGHTSLDIDCFTAEDQGVFYCVVQNAKGVTESNRVDMRAGQRNTPLVTVPASPSKAAIVEPPKNVQVHEGEIARFKTKVSGHPQPQVTWFFNGQQVQQGTRFRCFFDGLMHVLEITKIGMGDAGKVDVAIKNPHGVDKAGATLEVLQGPPKWQSDLIKPKAQPQAGQMAPTIMTKLCPANVMEGQPVKFEVDYLSFPIAKVTWFRENAEIKPSPDFIITTSDRKSIFQIPEVFIEDCGTFMVKVQNPLGSFTSEAPLKVVPHTATADEPPTIICPLQDINTVDGAQILFAVQCAGFPAPKATWFKDGVNVDKNPDFQLSASGDKYFLHISEVFAEDAGKFEVRLSNGVGEVQSASQLTVQEFVGAAVPQAPTPKAPAPQAPVSKPPSIDKGFAPQSKANQGEKLKLECNVSGVPQPTATWYHKGTALQQSTNKFTLATGNIPLPSLIVNNVDPNDAGEYILRAENDLGVTTCKTVLQVIASEAQAPQPAPTKAPEPPKDKAPAPEPPKEEKAPEPPKEEKAPAPEPPKAPAPEAPVVVEGLNDQTVPDGGQVVFTFKIKPSATPFNFAWYHKEALIKATTDFDQIYEAETGTVVLKIAEAFPEDDGPYKCVVTNETGDSVEVIGRLNLEVGSGASASGGITTEQEEDEDMEIILDDEEEFVIQDALSFSESLPTEPLEKKVGEEIILKVKVAGASESPPELSWTVAGAPVNVERVTVAFDASSGEGSLCITTAETTDSGEYVCTAKRGDESVETKAQVQVTPTN